MHFGNWYRPVPQLASQAALGVQFVIGWVDDGGYTRETYKAACRALGLSYIMPAPADDATLAAEAADPYCLGWDQRDEPNNESPVTTSPAELKATYAKWKAANPKKIVLLNFDASQNEGWTHNADGTAYDYRAACEAGDWIMIDFYVRNRLGAAVDLKATFGPILDRFKGYANGKPFGFFLEDDDQRLSEQTDPAWALNGTGPTTQDMQDYYDLAAEKGVQLVALFEDVIGKRFEGFGGDNAVEMVNVIASNQKRLATPLPSVVAGGVAGTGGTSTPTPTPTPPPVVTPPTPKPPVPAVTPAPIALPWTIARDIKRNRWQIQLPPVGKNKPVRFGLVTDPADVALLDAIAAKYPVK